MFRSGGNPEHRPETAGIEPPFAFGRSGVIPERWRK
jgi:hypothetical protein